MSREFKINNFDLLRLFAATEVLIFHTFPRINVPKPILIQVMANFPGVPMFFAMSGFLISAALERNPNLTNYFRNRALRIFPALWTCLILTVITISIAGHISFINRESLPWFFSQCIGLIYTPDFLSNYGFGSYNGSLWTIPLELQFYIILPITYFITAKFTSREKQQSLALLFIFLLFTGIAYYCKAHFGTGEGGLETKFQKLLRYSFIPQVYLFLLGVTLQRYKVYQSSLIYGKGFYWVALFLLFNYLMPTINSSFIFIFQMLFIGITTISLAYTFPTASKKILRGNDISYGVYIYHGLVLGVFVELKLAGNPLYVLLVFVITWMIALLSLLLIEKPFMKRKIKTIHRVTEPELALSQVVSD